MFFLNVLMSKDFVTLDIELEIIFPGQFIIGIY